MHIRYKVGRVPTWTSGLCRVYTRSVQDTVRAQRWERPVLLWGEGCPIREVFLEEVMLASYWGCDVNQEDNGERAFPTSGMPWTQQDSQQKLSLQRWGNSYLLPPYSASRWGLCDLQSPLDPGRYLVTQAANIY